MTKHVRMALVMEEKKKRRQNVAPVKEERKKRGRQIPVLALTPIKQVSY